MSFETPVGEYMIAPVHSVRDRESVLEALRKTAELDVSGLPVLDGDGRLTGVITRTDLLRAGRVRVVGARREHVVTLPDAKVRELMTPTVEVVHRETPLSQAARRMTRQRIHRLYVTDEDTLVGVISTRETMRAVVESRLARPIGELAKSSLVVVEASDPLSLAVDRMAATHHTGLVVIDHEWPVGVFTQTEALAARDAPPDHRIEEWMDPGVLYLPAGMPAYRAGAQALATRARRIIVSDAGRVKGIVTGMDFAHVVAS